MVHYDVKPHVTVVTINQESITFLIYHSARCDTHGEHFSYWERKCLYGPVWGVLHDKINKIILDTSGPFSMHILNNLKTQWMTQSAVMNTCKRLCSTMEEQKLPKCLAKLRNCPGCVIWMKYKLKPVSFLAARRPFVS